MRTFIIKKRIHQLELPDKFKEDDNRCYEEVVSYFIGEFTKPGDKVLDIFAGLGTTLIISEQLGRIPYGLEYLQDRCSYIKTMINDKENIIHGDARKLLEYGFPSVDLVYTSPLFMNKHETRDPLNGYKTSGNYSNYLQDLKKIFNDLKKLLKPEARVIVHLSNLKSEGITTLAWDVGITLSEILNFQGEVIVGYESPRDKESFGYDHSYNLVFSR